MCKIHTQIIQIYKTSQYENKHLHDTAENSKTHRVEDIFPQLSIILVIFNGGLKPDLDSTKIHSF